jgi:hypothetical protein
MRGPFLAAAGEARVGPPRDLALPMGDVYGTGRPIRAVWPDMQ